ncbi:MAG: chromosomal replication initiator protein DnaA [Acidobacteria bacterium]|nr:chromosomal replication initiator protein DnaA [Acidobacteriota bacterium]MCZ6753432.1 chromosomal replication initiator protein DnaA [Acidobacteriota bacterium]
MNPWEKVLDHIQKTVSSQSYSTWLKPARFSHLEDFTLFVRVPNETFRGWYEQNFSELLQNALQTLQLGAQRIQLVCEAEKPRKGTASQTRFDFDSSLAQLNPRYTFDTFVVGVSNQFAHAAADAVARNPSKAYNPLFLYGGVGMGKTHLMQAIGHTLRANGCKRLSYVSCEQFVNEMINSIRYDRMVSFHDRYRSLDALLVDDIHFLGSKERTQEVFFHTFNALYEAQKQIIITSDRPPQEIPHLEERLRSRFEWGLMADIQPPDLETKIAILMRKSEMQGSTLPDDVALFIASKIRTNIRELEGSLNRLLAYSSLTGVEITLGMAQQVLKSILASQEKKINIDAIQKVVADEFHLRIADLKAKNNSRKVVYPRQIAMFLCRELASVSLPEIGRSFGGKHHTTVLHSIEKIREAKKSDTDMNRLIHKLSDLLQ